MNIRFCTNFFICHLIYRRTYYSAVGESLLSTIVSIRDKIVRGKKLEKHERTFRQENPEYFIWNTNNIDEEAEELFNELWNKEGGDING